MTDTELLDAFDAYVARFPGRVSLLLDRSEDAHNSPEKIDPPRCAREVLRELLHIGDS